MKKALTLIVIAVSVVMGFFSVRGEMPFMPVFGISMEPTLHSGNLILIKEASPSGIKVGDIIVFRVPNAIQDHYGYPPIVAHRVIKVSTEHGYTFRTKGDNSGEDPFTVRTEDLRGTVNKQIPYLGLPLLFLQSQQGLIFVAIALSLFAIYIFGDELNRGRRTATRGFFAPIVEESQRGIRAIARRIESTDQRMENTQQALNNFASAIDLYAEHLRSHTSAIQGISEASHELKRSAAEQNRVLSRLVESITEKKTPEIAPVSPRPEPLPAVPEIPQAEPIKPKVKHVMPTMGHATGKKIHPAPQAEPETQPLPAKAKAEPVMVPVGHALPRLEKAHFSPGCACHRPKPARPEPEDEIFGAG